ncbi:hypothetical protein [Achromobacter xylosoxidans]|uniref:hypothetical protein n=1 Tax=Alcaligenes xylosoxydans xylosoxydans TaxID=85698 RepID=UPI003B591302
MINGGNILALQRILGHQDLKTTMRYAHLAPDHLESARTLNPLALECSKCELGESADRPSPQRLSPAERGTSPPFVDS